MRENEDGNFSLLMVMMGEAFGVKIEEARIGVYFMLLKDLEIDQIERAVHALLSTRTMAKGYLFPTIGEIRKIALGAEDDKIEDEATLAWGEVKKLDIYEGRIDKDGIVEYRINDSKPPRQDAGAVTFNFKTILLHPVTSEAFRIAFGTISDFHKREPRNDVWERLHFIKCYKAIAKKNQKKLLLGTKPIKLLTEKGEKK